MELEGLMASAGPTEAQDTTASILQGELERILLEAQLECERSSQTERCGAEGLFELFFGICDYLNLCTWNITNLLLGKNNHT